MKKWTKVSVTEQYISSCSIIESATTVGDYKTANKEKPKLFSSYKWLEKNLYEASEILGALLHCLCLNINQTEALHTLKTVSMRSDIWGFNAEKVLEVYNKNGFLKAY